MPWAATAMIFLVPVLTQHCFRPPGRLVAFVTAILSVMAYNFFFLPPLYTFTIADPVNWLSFGSLAVQGPGLFAGNPSGPSARITMTWRRRGGRRNDELYRFWQAG